MKGLGGTFPCPAELNPGLFSPELSLEVLREQFQLIVEKRKKIGKKIEEFLSDGTEKAVHPYSFLKSSLGKAVLRRNGENTN